MTILQLWFHNHSQLINTHLETKIQNIILK